MSFLLSHTPLGGLIHSGERAVAGVVNKEGHRIAGKMIGQIGDSVERRLDKRADEAISKLPQFVQPEARSLAHKGVSKVVDKGESLARKEVSKIRL